MSQSEDEVTPDGSPIAVYRALPTEPEFTPVLRFLPPRTSVLDLGCGVGRLANVLAGRGHAVTGVDEASAMLRHLDPAVRAVESSIPSLHLDEEFDVVVLASHFVNSADPVLRRSFVTVAAEHVADDGHVLIEHHELDAGPLPDHSEAEIGPVHISSRVLDRSGDRFEGEVTYRLGDRTWAQRYSAVLLDAAALDAVLDGAGLRAVERLSPKWTVAARTAEA